MSFAWPIALLLLLVVPALLVLYVWMLRRRRRHAVRYTSLSLVRAALPARSRWRRHLPVALLLGALALLAVGAARPQVSTVVPLSNTSIILTLDVSRSMCATDVAPNRFTVAQEAARTFVEQQEGTHIGLVAFAGFAEIVVQPTRDKALLVRAIDSFVTGRGTVIGSATLKSIDAIASVNPDVPRAGFGLTGPGLAPAPAPAGFVPDIIVLLTDGASFGGVDPLIAAEQAAERGVRVYTIGFGTDDPGSLVCTASQLGADAFDPRFNGQGFSGFGGGFGGFDGDEFARRLRQFLVIDEDTLRSMSAMTGGEYYRAEDADQLSEVFATLPAQVELQEEEREISVVFAALGAAFASVAIGLSMAWNRW